MPFGTVFDNMILRMKISVLIDETIYSISALKYVLTELAKPEDEVFAIKFKNISVPLHYEATVYARALVEEDLRKSWQLADKIIASSNNKTKITVTEAYEDIQAVIDNHIAICLPNLIYLPKGYKNKLKLKQVCFFFCPAVTLLPVENNVLKEHLLRRFIATAELCIDSVIIQGLIPLHLYSATEHAELNKLSTMVQSVTKALSKTLTKSQIKNHYSICSGFIDEEIMRLVKTKRIDCLFFFPCLDSPSELYKAIQMIAADLELLHIPIFAITESGYRLFNCQ